MNIGSRVSGLPRETGTSVICGHAFGNKGDKSYVLITLAMGRCAGDSPVEQSKICRLRWCTESVSQAGDKG